MARSYRQMGTGNNEDCFSNRTFFCNTLTIRTISGPVTHH